MTISRVDVIEACLAQVEQLNPRLNAFITVLHEDARARAKQADAEIAAGPPRGPMHGIPVAIKDFYDTAGITTRRVEDTIAMFDALASGGRAFTGIDVTLLRTTATRMLSVVEATANPQALSPANTSDDATVLDVALRFQNAQ